MLGVMAVGGVAVAENEDAGEKMAAADASVVNESRRELKSLLLRILMFVVTQELWNCSCVKLLNQVNYETG